MEDRPLGDLSRLVAHIEESSTSIAEAFDLCPDCGARVRWSADGEPPTGHRWGCVRYLAEWDQALFAVKQAFARRRF